MWSAFFVAAPVALLLALLIAALIAYPYAAKVGFRHLRSRKRKTVSVITFISVSGVALGVAALLSVMSITSGFQAEFQNKVLGVNAHVLVFKYGQDFEEYRSVMSRALEMPEVRGAAPFLIQEMMLAQGDRISGVLVKGVDPERVADVLDLPSQLIAGGLAGLRAEGAAPPTRPEDVSKGLGTEEDAELDRFLRSLGEPAPSSQAPSAAAPPPEAPTSAAPEARTALTLPSVEVPTPSEAEGALPDTDFALPDDAFEDRLFAEEALAREDGPDGPTPTEALPGAVLGTTLAENLSLHVGDRIRIISPLAGLDTSMFGGRRAPRSREFQVIGIFAAGFEEYDSELVYVDLFEAQRFFDHGDSVMGVELTLHDLTLAPRIARRLERVLGGGPYHTMDWQELNHNLFTALELQKVVLSLVIATIIFVAAFNVIATLIMIVLEKKREIAILKAMGARSVAILLTFMVQGLVIGLLGTAIGVVLGGGVCLYLERFAFPLDPNVYLIDHLPVRTSLSEFVTTIATAIGICLLATVVPSWWAARLLPADGVRYE